MRVLQVWSASSTDPLRLQTLDSPYYYEAAHPQYITNKNDIKYLHLLNEENKQLRGFQSHDSSHNR